MQGGKRDHQTLGRKRNDHDVTLTHALFRPLCMLGNHWRPTLLDAK